MKKSYQLLSLLLTLFVFSTNSFAQNNLAAGDLAIVSYQSDTDPTNTFNPALLEFDDRFSMVVLKPGGLAAGTVIYITDRGWDGPNNIWLDEAYPPFTFGIGSEAVIKWVVPAGGIVQGKEVFFINKYHDELPPGSEYYQWFAYSDEAGTIPLGTITNETPIVPTGLPQPNGFTDGMSLFNAGDNILVFQTGPPAGPATNYNDATRRFITAILANIRPTNVGTPTSYAAWDVAPNVQNESSIPPGLVNGSTCFLMSPGPLPHPTSPVPGTVEPDNGKFSNCALSLAGTCTALQMSALIYTTANWTYQNTVFAVGTSSSLCTYTFLPANTATLSSAPGTNIQSVAINSPITDITYTTTGATGATFAGLPPGVTGSWAANVVTITGSPNSAAGSPYNYTVTLTGGCPGGSATGTITVTCPTITVTNPATTTGTVGVPLSGVFFTPAGGSPPYVFTLFSGALPGGITLTAGGALTGTPTVTGTFNFIVRATDANGCFGNSPNYSITISNCPTITVTNPATTTGTVGVPFSGISFTPAGGLPPYTFSLFSGALPGGITLTAGGALTGTPTTSGTFNIVVTAIDANLCTGNSPTYNLVISCATNTWAGTVSNNWFTPANWSCGQVPTAPMDVVIPAGTPFPCVITGGAAQMHNFTINAGAVFTNNGTININAGGVQSSCGTYKGTGTFTGALFSNNCATAFVSPGLSPGCTVFGAGYTNGSGTEVIEIGGTTVCTQYDQLQVVGTATLSGTLDVQLFGGFIPSCGQSFRIMTSNTLVGTFATILYPALPAGLSWGIQYNLPNPGDVTLNILGTPTATATPASQTVCSAAPITTIVLSGSPIAGTTYNWVRDNTGTVTGIAASGSGDISGTLTNLTNIPITVTFTITPTSGSCVGASITAIVTVNPTPDVNQPANQVVCNSAPTAAVTFTGSVTTPPGTVFNWTNSDPSIGLAASGTGNIGSFTATNATAVPVVATVTVTPSYTSGGGPAVPVTFTNATAILIPVGQPGATSGQSTPYPSNIVVSGITGPVTNVTVRLINYNQTFPDDVDVLLVGPGGQNVIIMSDVGSTFDVVNVNLALDDAAATNLPDAAQIVSGTFRPTNIGAGDAFNAPAPAPAGGSLLSAFNGFAANGTWSLYVMDDLGGDFGNFNGGWEISVTGSATGVTCTGTPRTFTYTVNPTPVASITPAGPVTICQGNSVTLTASATCNSFAFSGLMSGAQEVPANASTARAVFNGTFNSSTNQLTLNVVFDGLTGGAATAAHVHNAAPGINGPVIIPLAGFPAAASGSYSNTFTVPAAQVANLMAGNTYINIHNAGFPGGEIRGQITNLASNVYTLSGPISGAQEVPANASTATGNFAGTYNNNTSQLTLNLIFNNLTGGNATAAHVHSAAVGVNGPVIIPLTAFPAATSGSYSNVFTMPAAQVANFLAGNTYINIHNAVFPGGEVRGQIAAPAAVCTGVTYLWTPGGATTQAITVSTANTYSVTATVNGCNSAPASVVVNVNPIPTVNAVANQIVCNGAPTTAVNFTGTPVGVVFNWTNNTTSIGLAASGTGNIASFTAINTGTAPVVATIMVTPSYTNGGVTCTGTATTFTITVNPTPTVTVPANAFVCNGSVQTTGTYNFSTAATGGVTTYTWTNDDVSIGLGASGGGNSLPTFTATNPTIVPITGNITVTPTFTNGGVSCVGTASSFSITVNPTPNATATPASQTICSAGTITTIVNSGTVAGTVFNWVRDNTVAATGIAASGAGNISGSLTNTTNGPVTVTFTITPSYTNGGTTCTGTAITATVLVNPLATVDPVANQIVCNGDMTTAVNFTSPTTGGTIVYNWTNNLPSIGLAASGSGNIAAFTATNATNAPVTATITVTPSYTNGGITCIGTASSFTITVNPTPQVNQPANQVNCNNTPTLPVVFTSPTAGTVTFNWTNNNTSIGLAASGTGNIASFNATNATNAPVVATVTVTPSTGGGSGGGLIPEVLYYKFDGSGTSVPNLASAPPAGTATATLMGTLTQGGSAICDGTSIGTGNASNIDYLNTGWAPNLGTGSWSISFKSENITPSATLFYCMGDINTASFRCFTNGVAGPNNWILRGGGLTDVLLSGGATVAPHTNTFVYDNVANVVRAYLDGVLVNTVAQGVVNLTGAGPFKVNGYSSNVGAPLNGHYDEYKLFSRALTPAEVLSLNGCPSLQPTCTGPSKTFTYTVNPTPTVNPVANQIVCNGAPTSAVNFTGFVPSTVYNWINNSPLIGLAASGAGNIASFTALNTGPNPVTATITVTPSYTNGGVTCTGTPITFTITVNPSGQVNQPASQVVCNNAPTAPVNFTTSTPGTIFNWVNNTPSIGLAASGTGNIASFTAINVTNVPVVATVTVTPVYTGSGPACPGIAKTFTITVNPTPTVNPVANQIVCNGSSTALVNFTGFVPGTIYNWTNNNTSIGLAASGSGNIGAFTAINTGTASVTATITVIPSYTNAGVTCTGTPITFTITVNPTPDVNQPANQIVCAGAATVPVNFTGTIPGTVYNWTNSQPSIGLAANGTGNIASFIAINTGTTPVVATIVVTPSYTTGGTTCIGSSKTFTITVNPIPTVAPVPNKVYCTGVTTALIPFNGTVGGTIPGTIFNWTNNNTAIGLGASGTGDIQPFVTTNTTNGPLVAIITVTPVAAGCVGTPITFTITVNPVPIVNPVASQTVCNGTPTALINFTSPTTGPTGALSFSWTNSAPSIGLAASGTGNIPSFIAVNTGLSPVIAILTVTAVYTNGGITCTGNSQTFTITVNPTPTVNPVANQVLCVGSNTAAVNFTGSVFGTIYNWTNNNTSIGLAALGAGNIASFIATNTGTTPQIATITVTPNYSNGPVTCPGTPITFTITVNPIPAVNPVVSQVVCAGATVTQVFSGPVAGTVYNWTNSNTAIGLAASGSGNISFTSTNATGAPLTGTITVTPIFTNGGGSCTGAPITFTITVNPIPTVDAVLPQVLCNGSNTAAVNFTGAVPGTVYSWTNNNTTIGLAASGTGNIASFVATNVTAVVQTATITVTPTYTNGGTTCTGTSIIFTITVNPTPAVNTIANQTVCNGTATATVTITGPVAGTVYTWTNNNTSIGLASSGTGNIASFTAINAGATPVTATITVTPRFTNGGITCTGATSTFTITVNPTAVVNQPANQLLCNGANTAAVVFSGLPPGSTYNWTNNNTAIGLGGSGTGDIPSFVATNATAAPITATITVTPTSTGCGGSPVSFTITVNPTPAVNAIANQTVCAGSSTAAVTISGPVANSIYTWANSNTTIGLGASGTGNIPAFVTVNPTTSPVTATITVTPSYTNGGITCTGASVSFTITVNPLPNIIFTNVPPRVCLTDTIVALTVTPLGGSWSGPGVSGSTFSAATAGIGVHRVTYTVTNLNGCTATAYVNVTVNDCIERHNVFATAIRLWPNPNNGQFKIQFNSDKYKGFKVKIINERGQDLGNYEFTGLVFGSIIPMDLRKLPSGMYFLNVYNTQESASFPFVITH